MYYAPPLIPFHCFAIQLFLGISSFFSSIFKFLKSIRYFLVSMKGKSFGDLPSPLIDRSLEFSRESTISRKVFARRNLFVAVGFSSILSFHFTSTLPETWSPVQVSEVQGEKRIKMVEGKSLLVNLIINLKAMESRYSIH